MAASLSGIIGAPVTPFTQDDAPDFATFEKQIDFLIRSGIDAIAYPMHIGESNNLEAGERRELTRVLVETVSGRVPTFVHVSAAGTKLAATMAEHAAKVGSDGIVLLPPYHWKSPPAEVVRHYAAVAGAHGGKLIAYNSPKAVQVEITIDIVRELASRIPGLTGVKDGTYVMEALTDWCRFVSTEAPHVSVFAGVEHLLGSHALGGAGCFSACSEVAPGLVRRLWDACGSGDLEAARELQYKVGLLLKLMLRNYPSGVKYAMEVMGRSPGHARAPLVALSDDDKSKMRSALAELGILDTEPHGWGA